MDTSMACVYHTLWHETVKGAEILIEAAIEYANGIYRAVYTRGGKRKAYLSDSLDIALEIFPARYRKRLEAFANG